MLKVACRLHWEKVGATEALIPTSPNDDFAPNYADWLNDADFVLPASDISEAGADILIICWFWQDSLD